ncbi:CAP domain-containing protein [Amycolatopsis sp. H20-H5]|uniref:CAP domain-containing protein n=1 Tax=Amycolatopsis sp. H20-H5 TaxID=3046309 RepID=UPI002DBE9147|nr:CAP domain-containing protein [Amycolatopsis sp. H20-H5]MEC3975602.1 CAP domain-containing protein [Amycolatopsis sp. H20-H5]
MSLSVLIGGASAGSGYLWLHDSPGSDTLSNAALMVPDTRMTGGPNAKQPNNPGGGDPAAPGSGPGGPAAPGTSPSSTTSTGASPSATPSSDAPKSDAPAPSDTPAKTTAAPPSPKSQLDRSLTGQVIQLVNDERAKAGCDDVSNESHLADAAQRHSDDMSARDYFSHDTPEGVHFDQRIRQAGYSKPGAENIARGAQSASQVMDMWMNSSGHRANILNCSLTKLGVGVTTDGWYWTQDFGY